MKYRKRPVTVEAVVWTGYNLDELNGLDGFEEASSMIGKELWVMTMEGPLRASVDDYIVRGICGEFYPCKPDIFRATYEEERT